jgi:hypothetical protein
MGSELDRFGLREKPGMNNIHDPVRENTSDDLNVNMDREMADRVREYSGRNYHDLTKRIEELEREWDIERVLEMNTSAIAFSGLLLGMVHNRKWLVLPTIVLPFLFQQSAQGWCPPLPILRRFGFRTRQEIDREKYALKYLRGDFDRENDVPPPTRALKAVTL